MPLQWEGDASNVAKTLLDPVFSVWFIYSKHIGLDTGNSAFLALKKMLARHNLDSQMNDIINAGLQIGKQIAERDNNELSGMLNYFKLQLEKDTDPNVLFESLTLVPSLENLIAAEKVYDRIVSVCHYYGDEMSRAKWLVNSVSTENKLNLFFVMLQANVDKSRKTFSGLVLNKLALFWQNWKSSTNIVALNLFDQLRLRDLPDNSYSPGQLIRLRYWKEFMYLAYGDNIKQNPSHVLYDVYSARVMKALHDVESLAGVPKLKDLQRAWAIDFRKQ
ncbi:uncharacterized protein CCR75_005984 [Bremia lactucae]|uniref:Uncharacterized protein n=1 Tax=Bremia lactucae TaxID=4779 RepID=A0A976IH15_BRELC|nr:hypothetical protein CCR75_005984 [Bremia lactucae]